MNTGTGKVSLAASSVQMPGVYRDILYGGDIREINVSSLCAACNNGWMNHIEQAASPVFRSIMNGGGFPPPADLFKLAHWSVVLGALSSELVPRLIVPEQHLHAIRRTGTGQPKDFSTHFVWTLDYLPTFQMDIVRFASDADCKAPVRWCFVLQVGWLVIITASPDFGGRVSKVLHDAGFHGVLGAISSNLVYSPTKFQDASHGILVPSHQRMQELQTELFAPAEKYLPTKGRPVIDMASATERTEIDLSFDYEGKLIDVRDQLDQTYLRELQNFMPAALGGQTVQD
ncbi:hypothetical protein [Paenarthrobacter nitroguajacolicus]|uniref:hypothetical protein n=1 Tax=Paenarthrobacter nitroguajacolicus TaxID=211146 RepID=UPI0028675879|nr:hypothetical protein [Paenarthrobacter nitroguajacolicus]MDR6639459.1 hypothetical protein [Paenarthrobacter nitroguajacolicus]